MPEWKQEIRLRLASLKLEPTREAEIVEELGQHLEDRHAELLAGGASEDTATRIALEELAENPLLADGLRRVERAATREPAVWGSDPKSKILGGLWLDSRYAVRMLGKTRIFSLVVVLTLALGIGACTAIFSIVYAVLLKTLPVKEPEALVLFKSLVREDFSYGAYNGETRTDAATGLKAGTLFPTQSFAQMRAQARTQESPCAEIFAFGVTDANVTIDGQAESLRGLVVSGNYYAGLGVQPWLGRVITDDDDKPGASPVVVFSHRYWERRFNSDPAVIGKQIAINNITFTLIGVTPRGFDGTGQVGSAPQVFVPIATETQINPERKRMVGAGWWWLRLMGRLKPGATMEQARAHLETVFQQTVVEHRSARQAQPLTNGRRPIPNLERKDYPRLAIDSGSQGELNTRQRLAPQLYLLFGIVGLVLLIACANAANLLLSRAVARQKEIAVRLALGAGRFRLIRQLLSESVLLAMLGAGFGLLFALWIKDVLLSVSQWGAGIEWGGGMEALDPQLDLRVLGFTFLLSLMAGILNPIGKRFGFEAGTANQIEIVGLSANAKYTSLRDEIKPTIYFPWSQEVNEFRSMAFEMRAIGEPSTLVAGVREAVRSVEGNLPVVDLKTQIEQSDETQRTERLFARLLSFFGALALLLASIGLYGVMAYAVAQRTHEMGIRVALGAQASDVLRLIIGQGMKTVLLGMIIGLSASLALTRLVKSLLFGVSATDPFTFAVIAALLIGVAAVACYVPARRATKVDPMVALRRE